MNDICSSALRFVCLVAAFSALLAFFTPATSEDLPATAPSVFVPDGRVYQCTLPSGCDAEITDNGTIVTVHHRKGDLIDVGPWILDGGDGFRQGWRRMNDSPTPTPEPKPEPRRSWLRRLWPW